jgi:serine/threonine-protein kinase haspin
VFEQSDEGKLSTFSLIDESISIQKATTKLHDLQKTKRVPQRQTSCFERSSLFYGLSGQANVVDILPKLSSKQIVLRRCGQTEPLQFDEHYSEQQLPNIRKIGEGVYGEVYMYKEPSGDPVVLKIIPIEGDLLVNGEPQKNFEAILSEVVITMELSQLRYGKEFKTGGFVELKKICCVQGAYPAHLIDLWELYRDNQGTENEHPDIFPEQQLYIVLELANAGQDLEAFRFDNAEQTYAAFLQVSFR